eukprot:3507991-Pyramimonas_sp.AAC.1
MAGDFSAQLYTHGFRWNYSSLLYLAFGGDSAGALSGNLDVQVSDVVALCLPRRSEMECLGCLVTTKIEQHHDVAWKLARGWKRFNQFRKFFYESYRSFPEEHQAL